MKNVIEPQCQILLSQGIQRQTRHSSVKVSFETLTECFLMYALSVRHFCQKSLEGRHVASRRLPRLVSTKPTTVLSSHAIKILNTSNGNSSKNARIR